MIKLRPIHVFIGLCILFLTFSFNIYLIPADFKKETDRDLSLAAEGRLVWQKYNCQSCHQLYGLGGYLGPDLTNVYSRLYENSDALKIFFKGGIKQMPVFEMTPEEEDLLVAFLKETDLSGDADPRNYRFLKDGMIQQNERK